ncbi:MAG: hypothetical protein AAGG08_20270 [Actinomycetota bacterium]
MGARARHAVTAGVVALLFVPVALDRDDFPLATYPMYSRARAEVTSIVTAVGVATDGGERRLGLRAIGATDDPLIAAGELRSAIRAGDADRRCSEIAGRVDDPAVVSVLVVTERHDVVEHVRSGDGFEERIVHASCPVARAG